MVCLVLSIMSPANTDGFDFPFPGFDALISFSSLVALVKISSTILIRLVRGDIVLLFKTWGKLPSTHPHSYEMRLGLWYTAFITFRNVSCIRNLWRILAMKGCCLLCFLCNFWHKHMTFPHPIHVWYNVYTFVNFEPCSHLINPTWVWYMSFWIWFAWILLRIFTTRFIRDISL